MVEGNNEKHFVGLLTALEKYQETNLIFRIVLSIPNTVRIKNKKAYYYNSWKYDFWCKRGSQAIYSDSYLKF